MVLVLTPKLLLSYICSDWLSMKLDDSCLWYTSEVSSSALAPPASKLLQSKPKCSPVNKIQHHIKYTWCEKLVSLKYSETWLGSMSWNKHKQLNLIMMSNFIQFSNTQHSLHDSLLPKFLITHELLLSTLKSSCCYIKSKYWNWVHTTLHLQNILFVCCYYSQS